MDLRQKEQVAHRDPVAVFKEPINTVTACRMLVFQVRCSPLCREIIPKFEDLQLSQGRKDFNRIS